MAVEQYTYWSVTLNNPTEADMLIVRNPNPKYVREFVWTPEEGAETGTPHVQGWLRLQRNQTQAFVKKLYPTAHLKPCRKDEYNENTHNYAQKDDATTRGPHTITLNDPMPGVESVITDIMTRMMSNGDLPPTRAAMYSRGGVEDSAFSKQRRRWVEEEVVIQKGPSYAKLFVSPVYERIWNEFARQIYLHLIDKQCLESDSLTIPVVAPLESPAVATSSAFVPSPSGAVA